MLKIGLSACFMYPDHSRIVFGHKTLSYAENDMMRYVGPAGVMPVLLPDLDMELLEPILNEMDGFVFAGGTDLAPETYGEEPIGRWKGDPIRDEYELRIMDYAVKSGKPILAICRGFQLMNAYFGGTLYQDIDTQKPGSLAHRSAELYDKIYHSVKFTEGGLLDELYKGVVNPQINTVHHQAVKDLGEGLEVLAISPEDGIIEAFEYTKAERGKVVGVQWHPEFSPTIKDVVVDHIVLYNQFLDQVKSIKTSDGHY